MYLVGGFCDFDVTLTVPIVRCSLALTAAVTVPPQQTILLPFALCNGDKGPNNLPECMKVPVKWRQKTAPLGAGKGEGRKAQRRLKDGNTFIRDSL